MGGSIFVLYFLVLSSYVALGSPYRSKYLKTTRNRVGTNTSIDVSRFVSGKCIHFIVEDTLPTFSNVANRVIKGKQTH